MYGFNTGSLELLFTVRFSRGSIMFIRIPCAMKLLGKQVRIDGVRLVGSNVRRHPLFRKQWPRFRLIGWKSPTILAICCHRKSGGKPPHSKGNEAMLEFPCDS